ncbi:IucA/IucC family protein [Arthrobacter mobilis]|uniref:IucA/IucC family siderophore biosynthesis protein n=1 Tax=Arthrobacter mobilis TaxID=2724944 RepID=A0A7X6K4T0_9MICC|nr:IucA/IucC family siderophore biosynthesis protein [Arthrobacter mobilis]NKX54985.1 IucA/IucC family siderophore biosynthesis protein [Arthrobacter mobilis]
MNAGHLTPERWEAANRHLVAKALTEFAHERLLTPEALGDGGSGTYRVRSDDGTAEYRFSARRLQLDHWAIDPASLRKYGDGAQELPLDALELILELRGSLGIGAEMLPVYLEEISSTLASRAFKHQAGRPGSAELAAGVTAGADPAADFQTIEAAMTEGHPCFVANNGRLGFGLRDYLAYAPEAGRPVQLLWIGVHRSRADFTAGAGLDYRTLLASELGAGLAALEESLAAAGADPEQFLLMPVHPWQWEHKLAVTFAADIARGLLVPLGPGPEPYQAQQSIRTFFNLASPERCYVKTALSILNMGFMRGLSPEYMRSTPQINDWLDTLLMQDPTLQRHGLSMLRERAAVGYRNGYYETAAPAGSPYRKMLAALWRESPLPLLRPGQQLATMAALLHVDDGGVPFVSALIDRSGLGARRWLGHYLRAYLVPLLHCLYRYELAFMPHGENVILVLEDGVPVRAVIKDIGEEVVFMGDPLALPEPVRRIRAEIPEAEVVLAIFTDVFDCFFRFLSAVLVGDGQLDEDSFWSAVAEVVHTYQAEHPELAGAFARHDLFSEDFALSCLNRLQLRNNRQMLDLADPSGSLQVAGRLANPLAAFRRTD